MKHLKLLCMAAVLLLSAGVAKAQETSGQCEENQLPTVWIMEPGAMELTCDIAMIRLTATGNGVSYQWSNGELGASIDVWAPDTYTVTATAANGCTNTASIIITQDITSPIVTIKNHTETTILTNSVTAIEVEAIGGISYYWEDNGSTSAIRILTEPGTYFVHVTGINGCISANPITITQDTTIEQPSGTCGANLNWSFNSATGELTITGTGDMTDYSGSSTVPWYSNFGSRITSVSLPDGITSIGNSAFYYCSRLTEVIVPESVTSIGDYAFQGCSGLTGVTIPEGVTSIGAGAFQNCSGLTGILIPNSIISIGNNAFYNCTGLTEITIPESVTSISSSAFSGCTNLASITIDEANTSFVFDDGVLFNKDKTILVLCLQRKSGSYAIPEGVTNIESSAFSGCTGLIEITIPESVTSIGISAFSGCTGLTTLNYNAINITSSFSTSGTFPASLTTVNIGNNVTTIGGSAFRNCTGLTEITIPEGVTSIGSYAFRSCTGLTEITIPESMTSIGESAFQDCSGLTEITIPEGVTSIGESAFRNCDRLATVNFNAINCATMGSATNPVFRSSNYMSLTTVNIGSNVTNIPASAFYNCRGLRTVNFNATNCMTMGNATNPAFGSNSNSTVPPTFNIGDNVTRIPDYTRYNSVSFSPVPNSITTIGDYAFSGGATVLNPVPCTIYANSFGSGSTIIVPDGAKETYLNAEIWKDYFIKEVSDLFNWSFENGVLTISGREDMPNFRNETEAPWYYLMPEIREVVISEGVTSVGARAFGNLGIGTNPDPNHYPNLESISISNTVTSIGLRAFAGLSKLEAVTIPSSVNTLDADAFDRSQIKTLVIEGCSSDTLQIVVSSVDPFSYSPIETMYIGRNIKGWIFEQYGGMSALRSITFDECVSYIEARTFGYQQHLQEVNFLGTVPPQSDLPLAFYPTTVQINVPCSAVSSYQEVLSSNVSNIQGTLYRLTVAITAQSNNSEMGEAVVTQQPDCENNYQAIVTATANSGYTFINWLENGEVVSTDAEYSFTASADRTLVAVFEAEPAVIVISGTVMRQDQTPISVATVELHKANQNGKAYEKITSVAAKSDGTYVFENVEPGEYLIRVKPQNSADGFHTYYESAKQWKDATPITVVDRSVQNVNITTTPSPSTNGSSVISGYVSGESGASAQRRASSQSQVDNPVPDITVYLQLRESGVWETVAQTITNENGYYEFSNIPAGEYRVIVDISGLDMDEIPVIELNDGETIEGIDYTVAEYSIYSTFDTTTKQNDISVQSLIFYPNPAKDEVFIKSDLRIENVEVYSLTGALLLTDSHFSEKINVSVLPQGVYLLKIQTNEGLAIRKLVKE